MFARYFERNNRKNAVERLRSKDKPNEHVPAVFNVGLLLGLTIPFFLEGIVESRKPSTGINIPQAGYLMQVWGGFALVVLFLLLFGINSWVWHDAKINYTFIFEFDTKHHLDYRQYLEVPLFLVGSVVDDSYLHFWHFLDLCCFG
jgi:xenotropic and polytropic retrovirus receptor 1